MIDDRVDVGAEPIDVDRRKAPKAIHERRRAQWLAWQGTKLGDRFAIAGDGHDLARPHPLDDLAAVVAEIPDAGVCHAIWCITRETLGGDL